MTGDKIITIRGRKVVPGVAEGEALVTTQPISGWGGVDPRNGTVVEMRHIAICVAQKELICRSG